MLLKSYFLYYMSSKHAFASIFYVNYRKTANSSLVWAYTESRNGMPRITERNEISKSRNGIILPRYKQGY